MKTTQTFSIQFIARIKKSCKETAFIYARITASKRVIEISLKQTILYSLWDRKRELLHSKAGNAKNINKYIENCRYRLMECYQQLLLENEIVSVEKIKSRFLGETKIDNTLLGLIQYHNSNMKQVLSPGTLKNYYTTEKYIKRFLIDKYKSKDIFLSALNYQFITELEFYLRTCQPLQMNNPITNNGVMKHLERLRKMVTMSAKMEWILKDPFIRYKLKFKKREMSFLNKEELCKIEYATLNHESLNKTRDLFIFCCYTGLAYIDLINLSSQNLCIGIDGEYWIKTQRQKTGIEVNVPILPKAFEIIQKYRNDPKISIQKKVLPLMSNQKINSYLKEVAYISGIDKELTFHCARHTFATTVTLTNGVPVETVSKMLGHTKLSTTQIYLHVLNHKISLDMKNLRKKLYEDSRELINVNLIGSADKVM